MAGRAIKHAVATMVAVVLALGLTVSPAAASKTLFSDALKAPSAGVQPSSGATFSKRFEHGHLLLQELGRSFTFLPPVTASPKQLSRVSISVDAAIDNPLADAGVICRYDADTKDWYELVMNASGAPFWELLKIIGDDPTVRLDVGIKGLKEQKPNNIRLDCTGPTHPGATGTVTLKVFVNGKLVATDKDSGSITRTTTAPAFASGRPGLRAGGGTGTATFNNLEVTAL